MTQVQISHYPLPAELYRDNLYFGVRGGGGGAGEGCDNTRLFLMQFTINGITEKVLLYLTRKY